MSELKSLPSNLKMQPHHGTAILVMGVLGFFLPLLAIIAAIMGQNDVTAMREGRMDNAGYESTKMGRTLGIIVCLFWGGLIALSILSKM